MTAIDRAGGIAAAAAVAAEVTPDNIAGLMLGDVGRQVQAWSAAAFGQDGGGAGPDLARLAQGGDIYGVRALAGQAAAALGATPAQEGALLRALEDFTRAAALNVNALAGSEAQGDALAAAINVGSSAGGAANDIDGVIARIERGTDLLQTANL